MSRARVKIISAIDPETGKVVTELRRFPYPPRLVFQPLREVDSALAKPVNELKTASLDPTPPVAPEDDESTAGVYFV